MSKEVRFEICIDSVQGAVIAQEAGAARVELCDNLIEGGTTPSAGMIQTARAQVDIGLNVIIRPRGSDFCYSEVEFEVMKRDVELAGAWGADGVVIGVLTPEGCVDLERTGALIGLARPLSVTFHRAFDMVKNPHQSLEDLVTLGVDRVLTSGLENSALEGLDMIRDLVKQAENRITVMPGGGIHERNVLKIVQESGACEVHISARSQADSRMTFRNPRAYMGGEFRSPEFAWKATDGDRIRAFKDTLK
jgi:copper homeostasis protein